MGRVVVVRRGEVSGLDPGRDFLAASCESAHARE
jgi:hypothetical protein